MAPRIHPSALVDSRAELADDVEVGPYCIVGAGVTLAEGCILHAHAVVTGPSHLGARNVVHPFAVVGGEAQHKNPEAKAGRLLVGEANLFREHVTVHRGTAGGTTQVGSHNLFMVGCHVAHDVRVGSQVTVANAVQLAGHAVVEDYVTFGGLAGLAQHVRVGESAFVAAGAMCERDVPPFVIVQGDRARVRALNRVGLERRGVPAGSIAALARAYRRLFASSLSRKDALREVDTSDPYVARLVAALTPPLDARPAAG